MKTAKLFLTGGFVVQSSINSNIDDEEIKNYFMSEMINVGSYPVDNFQECIKVEVSQ
jgi:hypothetical protein